MAKRSVAKCFAFLYTVLIMKYAKYEITGKELRVAISSKSGCGNTTVSTMVAKALGIPIINYTFRQMAAERGMTLSQVIAAAKTDESFDKYIDTHQVELARRSSCVLASRLAIWMLKEADIKVYLAADTDTRVQRIYGREGGDKDEIKAFTQMRDAEDTRRYKALYGIDNGDYAAAADVVIDTDRIDAEAVAEQVLEEMIRRTLVKAQ